jgi:hypothetical protein
MLLLKDEIRLTGKIMLDSTIELIRAGLKTDPTLSPAERSRLLVAIRSHGKQIPTPQLTSQDVAPKIIRRKQAAERPNSSLRFVDLLARQGVLKKCVLPGRTRAVGILESSLLAALAK